MKKFADTTRLIDKSTSAFPIHDLAPARFEQDEFIRLRVFAEPS